MPGENDAIGLGGRDVCGETHVSRDQQNGQIAHLLSLSQRLRR
jgi:hypothetical protein